MLVARSAGFLLFLSVIIIRGSLVYIVQAPKSHSPEIVVKQHAKGFHLITVISAIACLQVGSAASTVFFLQRNVHGVLLFVLVINTEELVLIRLLIIHLHILYGEVRQVFKHHLVVTLKEICPVERKVVYLLAVDEYLAVFLQLNTWQLLYQSVKHRAFRHVKRIGIKHQRITFPHHLYLGGSDYHFAQLAALDAVSLLSLYASHQNIGALRIIHALVYLLYIVVYIRRFIVWVLQLDDVITHLRLYLKSILRCLFATEAIAARRSTPYMRRVHHGRIRAHQRTKGVRHRTARKPVADLTKDIYAVVIFLSLVIPFVLCQCNRGNHHCHQGQ